MACQVKEEGWHSNKRRSRNGNQSLPKRSEDSSSTYTDKALTIHKPLGICFKVEGRGDTYMFPALLPPKDLSVMWKRDESKEVYVG